MIMNTRCVVRTYTNVLVESSGSTIVPVQIKETKISGISQAAKLVGNLWFSLFLSFGVQVPSQESKIKDSHQESPKIIPENPSP